MKKNFYIVIIIIVLIISAIICSHFISKSEMKKKDYELLQVSERNYFPLKVNEKFGVIKKDGNIVVEPKYDEVQIPNQERGVFVVLSEGEYKVLDENRKEIYTDFQEVTAVCGTDASDEKIYNNSILKYKKDNKYGLLEFDGKTVTDADYDEITSLSDKYGEVLVKKDNKYGVINIKGVILVPCKYDYIRGDGFSKDGSYKDGGYIIGNKTNKGYRYGYIDKNGKEIVKMEQEDIYRVTEIDSSDVYIVASQNGRYALFKNKENLTDYKYIDIDYNNKANVFTVQKNKTYGLIGIDGKVIIPEKYQELMVVGIFVKANLDGTEYNFDLNGNEVENSNFVSLESTSTGRFYISINNDYKYGVVDKDKNVVVENKYEYIEEIENTGLLIATVGKDITIYSGSLKEIVSVSDAKLERMDNYIKVVTSTEMYYLTSDGKKVDNKTVYLKNNLFASKSNNKWGFVDLKDNVKVPYEYDELTEFNEFGFAGVHKDGKWGVINENGEIVLEPTYESDEISPVFIGKYCLKDGIVKDSI